MTQDTLAMFGAWVAAAYGSWAAAWGVFFLVRCLVYLVRDRESPFLRRWWLGDAALSLALLVAGGGLAWLAVGALL